MTKRVIIAAITVALGLACGFAWAAGGAEQTWKGYVTDTYCGFNRVNKPPTEECTVKCIREEHAKYAFFNFADKKVYVLNPQAEAAKYAGQTVEVKGTEGGHEKFSTWKGAGEGAIITASSILPANQK